MGSGFLATTGVLLLGVVACSTSNDQSGGGGSTTAAGTGGSSSGVGGTSSGSGGSTAAGGSGGSSGAAGDGTAGGGGTAAGSAGSAGNGGGAGAPPDASATGNGGAAGASPDSGPSTGTGGSAAGDGSTGAPLTIRSTADGDFNNAFLVTSCTSDGSGFDCPNTLPNQVGCPQTPWQPPDGVAATGEVTGTSYSEVYNVAGGDSARIYDVTIRVRGQVEPRTYTGGVLTVAAASSTGQADPNGVNNLLYVGGRPGATRQDYNVFMLTIVPPTGAAVIPGRDGGVEPTFYAFNGVDAAHEGNHFNLQVDETFTIRVRPGTRITLTNHDSNCIAIKNCGNGGPYNFASATACQANARTIAAVTLPATFRGLQLPNGGAQPFQTQFLNFQVVNIAAE
jgi:hypothetical protein